MSTPQVSTRPHVGRHDRALQPERELVLLGRPLLAVGQQVAGGGQRHPGAPVLERLAQAALVAGPAAPGEDHLAVVAGGPQVHHRHRDRRRR